MPSKGVGSLCFRAARSINATATSLDSLRFSFNTSKSIMTGFMSDEDFSSAEALITKWDPTTSSYAKITSLFHENRKEARAFLDAVGTLQQTMYHYAAEDPRSEKLLQGQKLMKTAMKILQKEFNQILSANRERLDPESVSGRSSANTTVTSFSDLEDEEEGSNRTAQNTVEEVERVFALAMMDLQSIAECMISSGYGKECIKIYQSIRKSIIDESLFHLGFERTSLHRLQKLDWCLIEGKIKSWLHTVKVAIKTLFTGERIVCDHVFASSGAIKESCFSNISSEGALSLFEFPELITKCKKLPTESVFQLLVMYGAITELWADIDSIFNEVSSASVRVQVKSVLSKLVEAILAALMSFESCLLKEKFKSPAAPGIHPLSRRVMDYLCNLSDYRVSLLDILADWSHKDQQSATLISIDPMSFSSETPMPSTTIWFSWVVIILLCKLDVISEMYKDAGLSYLFLSINFQHVVTAVKRCNLAFILGDKWVTNQEAKAKAYAKNYVNIAWNSVISSLPEDFSDQNPPEMATATEAFQKFNSAFEETYRMSATWPVPDRRIRDTIRNSLVNQIVPTYTYFYKKLGASIDEGGRYGRLQLAEPRDLESSLSELFCALDVTGLAPSPTHPRC